jgi:hypothetical protein
MEHMFIIATHDLTALKSSDMHLTLPHLYKDPLYLNTYKGWADRGDFIMQDNSIYELKNVVAGDLLDFAQQIHAREVMVPEVLRSADGCVAETEEFFRRTTSKERLGYRFAACLQGKSWEEIANHYRVLDRDFNELIDTICIPFGLEFDCLNFQEEMKLHSGWNRFSNVHRLVTEGIWNPRKTHHLLGLHNPAELAMYSRSEKLAEILPSIRSNDSSICYRYGQYGAYFFIDEGFLYLKIKGPLNFGSRYTSRNQPLTFGYNRVILNTYLKNDGGDILWHTYRQYAEQNGYVIS